ncbi:MAG: hypothetical protein IPH77_07710 [Ignavibacteria bacterium]|nr:hypothetical protein [Ignavibacteria bacterium]
MIASPAVPIFMVQTLHLDYSSISVARGLVFYTATILFTPVMGRASLAPAIRQGSAIPLPCFDIVSIADVVNKISRS